MTTMVERVARAMRDEASRWEFRGNHMIERLPLLPISDVAVRDRSFECIFLHPDNDTAREMFNFMVTARCARAAIEATRYEDADEDAAISASASVGQIDAVAVIEAHNAFIDAALAEEG